MERNELKAALEAMIFVAEEPLEKGQMLTILADTGVARTELNEVLAEIAADWNDAPSRGLQLVEVAGGYQFRTKETCAAWVQRLNVPKAVKLSPAASETLAIIAYRQPCVRAEIESVRGVDSGAVIKTLLERRLVKIIGRRDEAGQPLIYGTTREFLELFNLKDLTDLPTLKDIQELALKRQVVTEGTSESTVHTSGYGDDDDEDPTDVIGDPEEEPTDAIEDDEDEIEDDEDESDEVAIGELEERLKDIQQLEKAIFPKPILPATEVVADPKRGETRGSDGVQQEAGGEAATDGSAGDHASPADQAQPLYRPVQ